MRRIFKSKKGAGAFTKLAIGTILFGMIFAVFFGVLVALGTSYGVSVESTYSFTDYSSQAKNVSYSYSNLTQGSSINQNVQDTAQLQGSISAESSKLSYWKIVTSAINDFSRIYNVSPYITGGIILIGLVTLGAALYYALLKIIP